jgi:hypothetical protein
VKKIVNKKSKQNAESLHEIGRAITQEWILKSKLPTLDEITRTLKKRPKRTEDDRGLKKKIADLFRSVGNEKRAKRIEASKDVGRAVGELIRVMNTETNAKRTADLAKKFAELFEDMERSRRAAAGGDLEKTIAELFRAIEKLKSDGSVSEGLLARARELAQSWYPEFGKSGHLLVVLLAGLVVAQKRELERLVKLRELFTFGQPRQKLTSKKQYDIARCYVPVVGKIEWEFGGVRPPGTSEMNDSALNCLKPPEPPTCLDEIFRGYAVNMLGLVKLFGIERHRLSILAAENKWRLKSPYDYGQVTKIMDALLCQEPRKRKSSSRGRPPGEAWLSDPPPAPDWRPVNAFWDIRHYLNCFWRKITLCMESCGALAICCDRASSICGAMKKITVDAYFSTMAISPMARPCVEFSAMFARQSCIISPGKAMSA